MNDPGKSDPGKNDPGSSIASNETGSFVDWLRGLFGGRNGKNGARDTLEELIEEREEAAVPIDADERLLLANILELRDRTIGDVMVPRPDIAALDMSEPLSEVIKLMTEKGHSRLPIFRETLDDAAGMVHIKDVLAWGGEDEKFTLGNVLRQVLFVSPSMQVLELLLEMRVKRVHMALVVDEYGGVDGLVTIEDLVEEIVGEIEDEHDRSVEPTLIRRPDGSVDVDARATIEALEEMIGTFALDEEREDINTLGGLAFTLARRVPIRGELIAHSSGLEIEVLDADPRRIRALRIHPSPARSDDAGSDNLGNPGNLGGADRDKGPAGIQ